MLLPRPEQLAVVSRLLRTHRVVGLLGPRQVGKTTLAKAVVKQHPGAHFFDLEDPRDLSKLQEPGLSLRRLKGLVILDEIQRRPDLFPFLRVLADRKGGPHFLILGSASPDLLRQSSETLAGRITYHELTGFQLDEVGPAKADRLWLRGGYPRSFTARSQQESMDWRQDFVRTFLERDLPQLGIQIPSETLRRFWTMLAHWHGQTMNWSELGRSLATSDHTVRHYLDILTGTFVVRQLRPWHENISKRQVRAPKAFLRDSGLLHALLSIHTADQLEGHPKVGASWDGFCLEAIIHRLKAAPESCFFWATHSGAELDLLVLDRGLRRGFEIKRTDSPAVTPSMRIAMRDLKLDSLDVIHAGEDSFPLASGMRAVALTRLNDQS